MKNNTLAIPAAPLAIPPKPKIAATNASTRKIKTHLSIIFYLLEFFIIDKYKIVR